MKVKVETYNSVEVESCKPTSSLLPSQTECDFVEEGEVLETITHDEHKDKKKEHMNF